MTIANYMDSSCFKIRNGIEFYYFGEGLIADYHGSSIAYLDSIDCKIISLLNESNSLIKTKACLLNEKVIESEEINYRIQNLRKKGVVVYGENQNKKLIFYGEKGLYYPKNLVIELTDICNYKCPFCYKNAKSKGCYISDSIVEKIYSLTKGNVKNVLFTGGEPTLHPHYLNYINMFSEYARVTMISNGSKIFEHDPKILRKLDHIQFTIYGCNDNEYKVMTGVKDGFTRLCKSVKYVKENNINTIAAVTLCDTTMHKIEGYIQTAITLGFKSIRIGMADVFGRGKYLIESLYKDKERTQSAYDELLMIKHNYRNRIMIELPNIDYSHVNNHKDLIENVYRNSLTCGCGSEVLVVSQQGKIRPCQMLPDDRFSIEEEDALKQHICGNFHTEELHQATQRYYDENNFYDMNIVPCNALDSLMKGIKRSNVL